MQPENSSGVSSMLCFPVGTHMAMFNIMTLDALFGCG